MTASDTVVFHLVARDVSPEAQDSLRLILTQSAPGITHRVIRLPAGCRSSRTTAGSSRPAASPPLNCIRRAMLCRKLQESAPSLPRHPIVLHAWSFAAGELALPLATTHRPMLLNAQPGDNPQRLAAWSRSSTLGFACQGPTIQHQLVRAGVPEARCAIVRPAVSDVAPFAPERRASVRRQLQLDDRHVLLTALPSTGCPPATFIATWATLLLEKIRPEVRLAIPRSAAGADRARCLAVSCRHERLIRFLPPALSWRDSVAASDSVVYLPPTDASLADLAYALAAGCPVVASAVPATTELLKDGQTAWFCLPDSPKDAARRMLQAIENPDQSCRQAHQARALAQRVFAAPLLIDGYRHMYLNLASRRPAASAQTHTGGAL